MPQFSVNTERFDPYKNFKFRVKWDGRYVAGVSKVSALRRTTDVVPHREGGDPSSDRKSPGRTQYEAITLERGVTHDTEFEKWANKVWNFGSALGAEVSLKDFRKDIIVDFFNEAGQLALSYKVYRCWVSEYQALPELDANANAVAIQTLKLENEGWERDYDVAEPSEPTFAEPRLIVRPLYAHDLLEVWEAGRDRHPVDRALILLGAACPELAWDELAGLSVGARDARLLSVREQTFGPRLDGFAECPRCAEGLQFGVAVADLRVSPAAGTGERTLELVAEDLSLRFRLPNSRDLGAAAACEDPKAARDLLVRRCVLQATRDGLPVAADDLPAEAAPALARRMAEHDPQAEVRLDLRCPACDHRWQASFDIVTFLWSELAAYARRLLREVHALARAYGWREADILSMSAVRRRSYIEMAT